MKLYEDLGWSTCNPQQFGDIEYEIERRQQESREATRQRRLQEEFGDIVIFDKDNNYSYQFCVVVDDIESNIDVVIRGEDIEPSTVKQAELWQSLSSKAPPVYIHHPLITSEGEKLSKSKDAPPLKDLLAQGLNREEIEKLMWKWIDS